MKKLKISLSIVAICLSIAVFCFGVFAATQVTYSIGGTVSYTVTDALVEIKTRVYSSQERATSDTKLLAMSNYLTNKTYIENAIENGTLTEITKYSDGRLDVNTLQDQREPAIYPDQTADTKINIDYSNSNYTWYIVVSITNIADNIVWANISKQSFTGDFNSYSNYTAGIDSIAKNETKTIVIGFSVRDEKTSIKDATFDYSLTISADQSAKPELDTNPRIESLGKYYTEKNVNIPLSTSAYSTSLAVEHDGDATVSETTTFGSVLNFKVPANTSNFDFKFDLILSMGDNKLNLSQISDSDISNLFKEIKILNNNVSNFVTTYGTSEYLNAKDCEISLAPIENSENKIFTCKVKNITSENISVVFAYGPLANTIYALFNSESLDFDTLQLQIQTTAESDLIEINTISETSIPMQSVSEDGSNMYYFSYVTNVPTNAQQLKFSLSTPLQVTDSSDATKKVNVLTLIQPMSLKGNYPTYESVVSAMGSDESWLDNNRLNPTTYSQSEDGSIIGAFPCGGLKQVTFFVLFDLSAEQIKELQDQGYDITKAFNCNVEITYMGISEDADTVKLNTIEKTEHLTIKKAYLEGEEENFTFDKSGNYYYQNFQVKNYFDKYDEMHLYLGGMEGEYSILKGNRDSIDSELTDIIATINSRNGIVTLTKDMGEYFCLVATSSQFKMTMKPSLEKTTYEYEILRDNTIAITRYWDDGTTSLVIPETIDGHQVSAIRSRAIYYNNTITELTVPDSIDNIEDESLYCPNLTTVTMPYIAGIYRIDTFNDPTYVYFPTVETLNLTKSGIFSLNQAFSGFINNLDKIKTINFSDEIKDISIYFITSMTSLENISFSKNVQSFDFGNNYYSSYELSNMANLPFVKNNTNNGLAILTARDSSTKVLVRALDSAPETVTKEMLSGVKVIASDAFTNDNSVVKTIELPVGLEYIGDEALYSKSGNTIDVLLPSTIKEIGSDGLGNIKKPTSNENGLVLIESYDNPEVRYLIATNSNLPSNITSAMLKGVRSIYCSAFSKTNIKSISLPESIIDIGNGAFSSTKSLSSIELPSKITKIKGNTFSNSSITSVNIPNGVTSIGSSAFSSTNISNIIIPNSVTSIGPSAFGSCKNLTDVTLSNNLSSISGNPFLDCDLHNLTMNGKGKKYVISNNCLVNRYNNSIILAYRNSTIPTDDEVSIISTDAFNGSSIANVVIPSNITTIEDSAFSNCKELVSVTMPDSVKKWGNSVFAGCSNLQSVVLPKNLTRLPSRTFYDCTSLTTIKLPEKIVYVNSSAFEYCTSLEKVELSKELLGIESYAFRHCKNLKTIELPSKLTSIGGSAFSDSGLTSLVIPDSVTEIGDYAFKDCSNLTYLKLSKGLAKFGDEIFRDCSSLTSITIPGNVQTIGRWAFGWCTNLKTVIIEEGVTTIGQSFIGCSNLTDIELPSTINEIGGNDFYNCPLLETIKIANNETFKIISGSLVNVKTKTLVISTINTIIPTDGSVTSIGGSAFSGKNITTITIPNTITSIGDSAFEYCEKLSKIQLPDSIIEIGYDAFYYCSSLTSITIPKSVTKISRLAFYNCNSLTNVTFEDTAGWSAYSNYNYSDTNPISLDVTNSSTNATYLTITYVGKYWKKS